MTEIQMVKKNEVGDAKLGTEVGDVVDYVNLRFVESVAE